MLLHGCEIPNAYEHSEVSTSQSRSGNIGKLGSYNGPDSVRNGFRQGRWNSEGRALSALSQFGENARMVSDPLWMQRVQYQRGVVQFNGKVLLGMILYSWLKYLRFISHHPFTFSAEKSAEKATLSSVLSEKGIRGAFFVFGELLFLARPVLYVLLVRKCGVRSWKPWIISLVVDLVGVGILSPASLCAWGSKDQNLSSLKSECDEVRLGLMDHLTYV